MTDEERPDGDEPGTPDEGREPEVVFRFSGDIEADVVKSLLESCGIPVSKESDISHIPYPLRFDGLGEVRLRVPAALADEARRVVADARAGAGEPEPDEDEQAGPGTASS